MHSRFDIFSETVKPFVNTDESASYLRAARERFDVLNLSYWFLGTSNRIPDKLTWLSTYDERYMSIYLRDMSPLGDPAFDLCFQRLLPVDWAEVRTAHEEVNPMHSIAESFGVGRHGISIPIREIGHGDAMFSINFDCEDRHWNEMRVEILRSMHLFAHYFHQRMKDVLVGRPTSADYDLSPREREVLKWAAEGKTAWETAQLLGVSERAIRLYTENAMNKLRAKTKTQAVAIAVKNEVLN
jgi:DNA-binding CsgD family transcriptional regulator